MKATVNVLSDGPEYLPVLALNSYYIKEYFLDAPA